MRKLKAYVQINAPVQTVKDLALEGRSAWMNTRRGPWLKTVAESWEATESADGTRFTLAVEYASPLSFLEPFMAERFQESVTCSLGRLKQMAENGQLRH